MIFQWLIALWWNLHGSLKIDALYQGATSWQGAGGVIFINFIDSSSLSNFNTWPFLKQWILDSSKLKEFADDNFEFDEIAENSPSRAISSFPTVFSKDLYWRHVKTRACLGKG